jgi:hypothetical protein
MSQENTPKETLVGVGDSQKKLPRSKLLLIAAIVLGVVLLGVGVWSYLKYREAKSIVCGDKLSQQAAASLTPSNYQVLKVIVDRIAKLPNYEKDPNCLYPIIQYDVYVKNEKDAQDKLAKLQKVYNPKKGFNDAYDPWVKDLKQVEERVAEIKKFNEQVNKNKIYVY